MALEDELRGRIEAGREDDLVTWAGSVADAERILAALTERKAPVEVEGSENKAGGLWYRRWFKTQVLNNELTACIAELEAENFTLAAGQCTVENGLIGDEHGHFACSLKQQLAEREEALAWYGEQARLARLIHSEGDVGRAALAADGGKRARALTRTDGGDQ